MDERPAPTDPDLTATAREIYSSPLADFISTRNARAKEATGAGLAAGIKALRKPSVAAWVVNLFARERKDQLSEALQLAAELREAQADLDARALAQLGRDRRALTSRLAAAAAALAEARGEKVTVSTRDAVQQTISAAFFDPDAAAAVASGRLVRELEPAGSFADIMDTIVGGGAPDTPVLAPQPVDEVRARRERKSAERALRDAEQRRDRVASELAKIERGLRDTANRLEELAAREQELVRELDSVRRSAKKTQDENAATQNRRSEAADRLADAETAVSDAEQALADLADS